jgi:rod shape-determining protein MreC
MIHRRDRPTIRLWQLSALVILSIMLMSASYFGYASRLHGMLDPITTPVYQFVDNPLLWWDSLWKRSGHDQALIENNAKLRAQVLLLQAKLQRVQSLEIENKQLMSLLRSSSHVEAKVLLASVMNVAMDPFAHQVLIDRGSHDDVFVGQAVLDAYGVFGQVVRVMKNQSVITLIDDESHAIPVEVLRNHTRGVMVGAGQKQAMRLINITQTRDVTVGDKLISSGLGQHFPSGYPVGRVKAMTSSHDGQFMAITVDPSAHLNQSRQVLLVWSKPHFEEKIAAGARK